MNCHEVDYESHGDDLQMVEVELDPREAVIAEAGTMNYMEDGIAVVKYPDECWHCGACRQALAMPTAQLRRLPTVTRRVPNPAAAPADSHSQCPNPNCGACR